MCNYFANNRISTPLLIFQFYLLSKIVNLLDIQRFGF